MMVLERWVIAVILGVGLVLTVGSAPGQAPSATGQAAQPDQAPPPADADQPPPDPEGPFHAKRDQAPPDQATPDPAKPDQPAAEQAKPEQPAANQPVAEKKLAAPHGTPEEQQLQKDTDRLLQLAQELKVEVEKAGNNTLSVAAVRKADELLKLSKNLKERMKDRGQAPQSKIQ
jgi:hypothetical protein